MTSAGRNLFHGRQHFELRSSVCIGPHWVPICPGIAPKRHHLPNSPLGYAYPSAAVVDCPVCVSADRPHVRSHFQRSTEG